jgi:RNase P protein component
MDIQTRKLNFIQEFLQIPSEDFIISLEKQVKEYRQEQFKAQLNAEIDISMEQSAKDQVVRHEGFMEELLSWD